MTVQRYRDNNKASELLEAMEPPHLPFTPVRTALLTKLETDAKSTPKVISFVAPTGAGKTVTMLQLFNYQKGTGNRCIWAGVDEQNSSLESLLKTLLTAIAGPKHTPDRWHSLFLSEDPLHGGVDEFLEILSASTTPTIFFLDNLNACRDESLTPFLEMLMFQTPPSIQFVWSSNVRLGINSSRAKMEGLLQEISFEQLNFSATETAELLGEKLNTKLGSSAIESIFRRTEGWAAAIRMVQLILLDAEQPEEILKSFSGADGDIADLLKRNILNSFKPEFRQFLLSVAYLNVFSVDMCRHVMNDESAEEKLDYLLQRNAFIIPLDRNRKLYRLHKLFRDAIQYEANKVFSNESRQNILSRAAEWYEQNENWQDAIQYALAANNNRLASKILHRRAPDLVGDRGDISRYIGWIDRLRSTETEISLETHFWYIWALVFNRRYANATKQHEFLLSRLNEMSHETDNKKDNFTLRLDHLRICIDLLSDRISDANKGADLWLASPLPKEPFDTGWVRCIKGVCLLTLNKLPEAKQAMRLADPVVQEVGSPYIIGWCSLIKATTLLYEGNYSASFKELSDAMMQATESLGQNAELVDTMALIAAKCATEMGLTDHASKLLHQGLRSSHRHGTVGSTACGFDAVVALWNGESRDLPGSKLPSKELPNLTQLQEIASSYPPRLSLMLSCSLARRYVALGLLEEALAEAGRIGINLEDDIVEQASSELGGIPRYRDLLDATRIDLLIASRQYRRASSLIESALLSAQEDGRFGRVVELRLSQATIAVQQQKYPEAIRHLKAAVLLASPRKIVKPFTDCAAVLAHLVEQASLQVGIFAQRKDRDFLAEIITVISPDNINTSPDKNAINPSESAALPTNRELELLSLINNGLSNQEIADHLGLSISTVKWHLKNLYQKLNVSNRSAALAKARTEGFMSR